MHQCIYRDLKVDIVLDGRTLIKGGGINFSGLTKIVIYPLIYGEANSNHHDRFNASIGDNFTDFNNPEYQDSTCLLHYFRQDSIQNLIKAHEHAGLLYGTRENTRSPVHQRHPRSIPDHQIDGVKGEGYI
ncbi:subtilisin-like serine endopeptidase family protein [Striga asiatica]|uniref:Subtilisin-like serine endopeptidase family protein n=1 Tax=Striga asiatica TaxID=4170 RepID=A0A5A7NY64_STRAF|nr:subtilisin-like serine endopeptidase family protein [Striga asiatica]